MNQSGISMKIYHVRGGGSAIAPKSVASLSDVLSQDEDHVKALTSRVVRKGPAATVAAAGGNKSVPLTQKLKPKWMARISNNSNINSDSIIPLNPGLSIGSGNYYVKIGIGSPPKYYAMILDTGSSLTWLQCRPCSLYCHSQVDPLFDPSASKTYRKLQCSSSQCSSLKAATLNPPFCEVDTRACIYTASYGDSSYSIGYLSQDLLTLTPSTQTLPGFTYGCGEDNEGLFGRAAGIVGLARDKLSMISQLSTKYAHAFSYCLPTLAGGSGGYLSIGEAKFSSSYKFTPMLTDPKNPSLYFLRLVAIKVGGRPLPAKGYAIAKVPTIIDSGTVITRLPEPIYGELRDAFAKIMTSKGYAKAPAFSILDTCFNGSTVPRKSAAVPEIEMIFQGGGGAALALQDSNILVPVGKGVTCLAFASGPSAGTNAIAVIGNHQQQTYSIAYDISNSRIGFAPRGCH
ncbi:hypothetical protein Tsubulata_016419 [Turnera subulata]|uniref:Peptidase A1 domain-containing protein n=1 Tax=Turnera subulata TaxID=218843 RepID=A0A9Q0F2Z0_9ROSI|nr:hypothetical protein Tsubulata_016419 [Turnera subulata]